MEKEHHPGCYALATGGVQAPDESNELNAQRELEEELGIVRKESDMQLLDQFRFRDQHSAVWGNVFHVRLEGTGHDLKLQAEEVSGVEYWTRE